MRLVFDLSIVSILFISGSLPSVLLAEEIDFSDESIAKEILLGKTWNCQMDDVRYGKSTSEFIFDKVTGKKVKGKFIWMTYPNCSTDPIKGKLKKNILKYTGTNNTECSPISGSFKFYRDASGQVKAEGYYKFSINQTSKYKCE